MNKSSSVIVFHESLIVHFLIILDAFILSWAEASLSENTARCNNRNWRTFFLAKKKENVRSCSLVPWFLFIFFSGFFSSSSYFSVKKKQLNFTSFFRIPVFYVPFKAAKSCLPCQSFLFMRKAEPILLGLTVKYVTDGSGSFPLSR